MKKWAALLIILATPAVAHTGHGSVDGAMAGLAHPFTGLDHLVAMVTVGLIAGASPRFGWRLPAAFLAAMLGGFLLQSFGLSVPQAEMAVAASVLLLGLTLLAGTVAPAPAVLGGGTLFGLAHGYVHGVEAAGGLAAYGAGFLLATLLLHAIGYSLAKVFDIGGQRIREAGLGAAVAMAGLAFISAQVA